MSDENHVQLTFKRATVFFGLPVSREFFEILSEFCTGKNLLLAKLPESEDEWNTISACVLLSARKSKREAICERFYGALFASQKEWLNITGRDPLCVVPSIVFSVN